MSERSQEVAEQEAPKMLTQVFRTSLILAFLGRESNVKFSGTKAQLSAIEAALTASKDLHEEFHNPSTTVPAIMKRLDRKRRAASDFERVFGFPWPL